MAFTYRPIWKLLIDRGNSLRLSLIYRGDSSPIQALTVVSSDNTGLAKKWSEERPTNLTAGKTIRADDFSQQIKLESKLFQTVMDDFELKENNYPQNHPELF